MSAARSSLGRGLGELTDEASQADTPVSLTSDRGFFQVPLDSIAVLPRPADGPAAAPDAALVDSVRAHGILQPLLLRRAASGYELIDGRQRLEAATAVGLRTVPAFVLDHSVLDAHVLTEEANRHRRPRQAHAGSAAVGWGGSARERAGLLVLLLLVLAAGVVAGHRTSALRREPAAAGVTSASTNVAVHVAAAGVAARPAAMTNATAAAMSRTKPQTVAGTPPVATTNATPSWVATLAGEGLTVAFTNGEAVVAFLEPVFSSYATLSDGGARHLRQVAERIAAAGAPLSIAVRGHTDPKPVRVGGRYADNFELGLDRATSALQYLRYHCGLTNTVLVAVSCSELNPPFPNDTPESSFKNRTVTLRVNEVGKKP
jgi:flagellar motor protein MotB